MHINSRFGGDRFEVSMPLSLAQVLLFSWVTA